MPATASLRTLRSHLFVFSLSGVPCEDYCDMERTHDTVAAVVCVSKTMCSSWPSRDTHCLHEEYLQTFASIVQKPRLHTMTPVLVEGTDRVCTWPR